MTQGEPHIMSGDFNARDYIPYENPLFAGRNTDFVDILRPTTDAGPVTSESVPDTINSMEQPSTPAAPQPFEQQHAIIQDSKQDKPKPLQATAGECGHFAEETTEGSSATLTSLENHVLRLENELLRLTSSHTALQLAHERLSSRCDVTSQQVASCEAELERVTSRVEEHDATLSDLQARVDRTQERNTQLHTQLQEQVRLVTQLQLRIDDVMRSGG